jgi:hypothetical protein
MNSGTDSQQPQPGGDDPAPRADRRAQVVRLLPIAVLVVSGDRYFRSAATMLLSRRGCVVLSAADEREARDHAVLAAVDVLVVEPPRSSGCCESASELAAQLDEASREAGRHVAPVGVVVVGEPERLAEALDARAGAERPVLDKWGPFERLHQAIVDRDGARRLPARGASPSWPAAAPRLSPAQRLPIDL